MDTYSADRKNTEEKNGSIKLNDDMLWQTYFEESLMPMAITLPEKGWYKVNESLCSMLGYTEAALKQTTWAELTHPDDLEPDKLQFVRLLNGEIDAYSLEKRFLRKDGQIVYTILSVKGVRKSNGSVQYILAQLQDITERKQAEQKLQKKESRLRMALQAAGQGFYDLNLNTGEALVSPEYASMLGFDPDTFHETNARWLKRLHPDDLERVINYFVSYTEGSIDDYSIEFRQQTASGDWKWILSRGKILEWNSDGTPARMMGTHTDIDDKKRLEEAVRTKRQEVLSIFDAIDDVIYVADPETYDLLFVNDAFKKNWGEDDLGRKCYKVLQNLDAPCSFCTNNIIFNNNGQPYVWEFQNKTDHRWYRCTDKAVPWVDGRMVRFEIAYDITQMKKNTEDLIRIRKAVDASSNAIGISTPEGRHFYHNPAFTELFGYGINELESSSPKILYVDPDQADEVFDTIMKGGSWKGEVEMEARNSRRFQVQLRADSVKDPDGALIGLIGTHTDITEQKMAEEQLRSLNASLERSNEELQQFAYVASHDLQEPLRMVSSYTQLLQKRYDSQLDEKARKYIHYAVDGAVRMQRLIQDLLMFSRVTTQGDSFENIDSRDAFKIAEKNLQSAIKESGAQLICDDLPTVSADKTQLSQVFQNLIANAIKFHGDAPPRVHISAAITGSMWQFSIQDNGIGIEPQYRDKIFVIFQRLHTRREYPGTGIGLALCKRIIERHRGEIWFEAAPGGGTIFYFTLREKSPIPASGKEAHEKI